MKNGGAEVISVNNYRVTAHNYFVEEDEKIIMNGNKLDPPYRIKAIGNPEVLYSGLTIPGGIIEAFNSLRGVEIDVKEEKSLKISPTKNILKARYSEPVLSNDNDE